ncbi:MAG: SpoIID/LytB domain-containing protein [Treponema sp.]|nr:SpoIID/LytB domain-containing protein [Treponema sp.]
MRKIFVYTIKKSLRFFLCCAIFLLLSDPLFSMGEKDGKKSLTPLRSYYAGQVEEAAAAIAGNRRMEEKPPLVVLYWELGEMTKAAELLEELLKEQDLPAAEKTELQLELFITYCLLGNYSKASALRNTVETGLRGADPRLRAEFYFYSAYAYHETGNARRAEELYKQSLGINKWRPIGWYRLGLLLRESNPREAEKCLQTCWEQDSSFTNALLPLARLLGARKEWRRARDYLITANARLPNNREISTALTEARRHAPGGGSTDYTHLIRREIRTNPPKITPAPAHSREGLIRIGLIENQNLVSVKAGGNFTIHNAGNSTSLYNGLAEEQIWVEWIKGGNGALVIQDKNKKTLVRSSSPLVYKLNSNNDSSTMAGVVRGAPGTNRTYRGAMEFRPGTGGITVVNVLPMEDYLYGVVPAEMPANWPAEALKAQTIAARSYAIANRGQFSSRGFDIFGTPHSQAYHGVGAEHKNTTAAVDATRGMILLGGRQPLKAYYSANHGGYSEDSLTLWGYDAYMQAVPDKLIPLRTSPLYPDALYRWIRDNPSTYSNMTRYSYISAYRWEKWVTPAEIRRRLPEDPGEIYKIITRGRGISGRIVELDVYGDKKTIRVKGDAIWNAMGSLRSSLFTIRYKLVNGKVEYFVFQGAGYGHGIGMDQHGAAGMASVGLSASEILLHYYPKAEPERL